MVARRASYITLWTVILDSIWLLLPCQTESKTHNRRAVADWDNVQTDLHYGIYFRRVENVFQLTTDLRSQGDSGFDVMLQTSCSWWSQNWYDWNHWNLTFKHNQISDFWIIYYGNRGCFYYLFTRFFISVPLSGPRIAVIVRTKLVSGPTRISNYTKTICIRGCILFTPKY